MMAKIAMTTTLRHIIWTVARSCYYYLPMLLLLNALAVRSIAADQQQQQQQQQQQHQGLITWQQLTSLGPFPSNSIHLLASDSDRGYILFSTYENVYGRELWRVDANDGDGASKNNGNNATSPLTAPYLVRDLLPGPLRSFLSDFVAAASLDEPSESKFYFSARDAMGDQLWVTRGTNETTRPLTSFVNMSQIIPVPPILPNDRGIIFSYIAGDRRSVYLWDETSQQVRLIVDNQRVVSGTEVREVGGVILLALEDGEENRNLYALDPTSWTATLVSLPPHSSTSGRRVIVSTLGPSNGERVLYQIVSENGTATFTTDGVNADLFSEGEFVAIGPKVLPNGKFLLVMNHELYSTNGEVGNLEPIATLFESKDRWAAYFVSENSFFISRARPRLPDGNRVPPLWGFYSTDGVSTATELISLTNSSDADVFAPYTLHDGRVLLQDHEGRGWISDTKQATLYRLPEAQDGLPTRWEMCLNLNATTIVCEGRDNDRIGDEIWVGRYTPEQVGPGLLSADESVASTTSNASPRRATMRLYDVLCTLFVAIMLHCAVVR